MMKRFSGSTIVGMRPGLKMAQPYILDAGPEITVLTPPIFIATKLEAFGEAATTIYTLVAMRRTCC